MRFQSTWPSKDIFHEYAIDFAKKVNDMTGGDLKIEVLPAGAVVPAFQLLDAVSKGVLDGGHGVLAYHYGKQTALALWGSGPAYAMDANMMLAWHKYGGGKQLLEKIFARRSAPTLCRSPTVRCRPSRWAGTRGQSPSVEDFKGLKYRTVGISIDLFTGMGAAVNALPGGEIVAAMDRGLLDAAEFNNASSDRALGFADVSKVCMLQSYHQNAEQLEIIFNKTKFDGLPAKMRAIIENGGRGGVAGHVVEGDRSLLAGLHRRCRPRTTSSSTRRRMRSCRQQLELYDEVAKKYVADQPAVQGDHRIAACIRQAGDAVGARLRRQAAGWRSITISAEREEADLTRMPTDKAPSGGLPGWCFVIVKLSSQTQRRDK